MTDCKILVTSRGQETLFFALEDDKPVYLARSREMAGGGIFAGRVENYIRNLKAAFVRFDDHEIGYLPLDEVPQGALLNRPYEKGDELKAGDLLCVQMRHAARGTKQAKLSGYLTLHGEYAVLGLEKSGVGCSKTLESDVRRELVRAFRKMNEDAQSYGEEGPLSLDHFGVILRTECGSLFARHLAEGHTREQAAEMAVKAAFSEVRTLYEKLKALVREGETRPAGSALFRPDQNRAFHDRLALSFHFLERAHPDAPVEIVCVSEAFYETAKQAACTSHERVSLRVNEDLDAIYGITAILVSLSHNIVWLKSGAYLVIEGTEAMTVVDVNSGKYTAKTDDDFIKVNLEAAEAVMREIRLRDLSGIIVVDFINMREGASYTALKERLTALAACDPVFTRFHDITALGLAEITRTAH